MAGVVKPVEQDICRSRGDTEPIALLLTDANGAAIDITGWALTLTIDPNPDPADGTTKLFDMPGVITSGPGGAVQFEPTTVQMDIAPNTYFYDVQRIDGLGKVRTILKGEFIIEQDITK